MEDKARWEGLVNRIHGFSLAESLPEKRRGLSVLQAVVSGCESSPAGLPALFIWGCIKGAKYCFALQDGM